MSFDFPKLLENSPNNVIFGSDFDLMKREPIHNMFIGYNQKVFKFNNNDRFIPSRNETTMEFLQKTSVDTFDVSSSENCMKTIKKIHYQNHIRKVFLEGQQMSKCKKNEKKEKKQEIKFIHTDWACKISDVRLKFLPDFETLKKPIFGLIYNYVWSKKEIIAASSYGKLCLYHPYNGFTRALDVNGRCCIAFSNNGNYLAMAYRKSSRKADDHDLYVFRIDRKTLFNSENLETEKVRTTESYDITALCYSKFDNFLVCGTDSGKILVLECIAPLTFDPASPQPHSWKFVKFLCTSFHKRQIKKISFSANFLYMASLDAFGQLVIWTGESWTMLFCLQKENSQFFQLLEWHPFVDEELVFGKSVYPALFLINVVEKQVVACHMNWKEGMEITSIAFNPISAQLAVCFYIRGEYINRVSLLASMSQVINTFDFDYVSGGLHLFWNSTGTMLGAGGRCFRFAFWSFHKSRGFPVQMVKDSASKNPVNTLNDFKLSSLR